MFHPYHQVLAWDVEPPLALATLRYIPRTPASSRAIGDSHVGFPRGFPTRKLRPTHGQTPFADRGIRGVPTSSTIRGIVFWVEAWPGRLPLCRSLEHLGGTNCSQPWAHA